MTWNKGETKETDSRIKKYSKKISISKKEYYSNPENRKKLQGKNNPMYGKKHTEESKRKKSDTLTNRYNPNLKIDFFEDINTENKAYWLGFLYGDGYVYNNTIRIHLKKSDKNHLIKFKNILNINNFLVENSIFDHYNKLLEYDNNVVSMRYSGKQIVKFLDYIYKDNKIYLDRKYNLYEKILLNHN